MVTESIVVFDVIGYIRTLHNEHEAVKANDDMF